VSSRVIYVIRNLVNGKVYVGQSVAFHRRRKDHLRTMRGAKHCNVHLSRAAQAYGWESFAFDVLEVVAEGVPLGAREFHWIQTLRANDPQYGYNIMSPDPSGDGHDVPQEVRDKISAANRGRVLSEETRRRMSASRTGRKIPREVVQKVADAQRGKLVSAETRAKLSAALKGRKKGPVSAEARAKLSAAARGRRHGPLSDEHRAKVSAAMKGRAVTWGAKIAEASRGRVFTEEHKAKLRAAKGRAVKPVLQLDEVGAVIAKHPNQLAAATAIGIAQSTISSALRKGHKAGGYKWRYEVPNG
jgi:group I intron endonuclease